MDEEHRCAAFKGGRGVWCCTEQTPLTLGSRTRWQAEASRAPKCPEPTSSLPRPAAVPWCKQEKKLNQRAANRPASKQAKKVRKRYPFSVVCPHPYPPLCLACTVFQLSRASGRGARRQRSGVRRRVLTKSGEADGPQATANVGGVHQGKDRIHQQGQECRKSKSADLPVVEQRQMAA